MGPYFGPTKALKKVLYCVLTRDVPDSHGLIEGRRDDHVLARVEHGAHYVVTVACQHAVKYKKKLVIIAHLVYCLLDPINFI